MRGLMGDDISREAEELVEDEVEDRLEVDDDVAGTFSKKEVMQAIRKRLRWKGTADSEGLTELRKNGQISRRKFLQMLGLGVGGAFVSATGVGYFMGTKVFGNGEHLGTITGLQGGQNAFSSAPGNSLVNASSFSEAVSQFQNGNTVVLAAGEYDGDAGDLRKGAMANASLIGDGEVIIRGDYGGFDLKAEGGNVLLKNITLPGVDSGGISCAAHNADDTITFSNVNKTNTGEAEGFYVDGDSGSNGHVGTVEFLGCYVFDQYDNGYYASSPGQVESGYGDGPVVWVGSMARNCNTSGIRPGSSNSVVQNCVVVNDAEHTTTSDINQRGVRVREPGSDIRIENTDVAQIWDGAGVPVIVEPRDSGSTGSMQTLRILNNTGNDAIEFTYAGDASQWSGDDICIEGSGSHAAPGNFNIREGNCQVRTEKPQGEFTAPSAGSPTTGPDANERC